nr:LuxR C-terminal-related transcriptional regulator [Streptomyces sp. NBC_00886]
MISDDMRADDLDLLKSVGRRLRHASGIPIVFGGLAHGDRIPVTMMAGDRSGALRSIVLQPSRGLGGLSWLDRKPLVVEDYAGSHEITHDYDGQVLGEGIRSLAVAPIIVQTQVRGLIYGGFRSSGHLDQRKLEALRTAATMVSTELDIRDRVEARVRVLWSTGASTTAGPVDEVLRELHARIRLIAARTSDPATAVGLRSLLSVSSDQPSTSAITSRQADVLTHVALGLRNDDIAGCLGLSVTTVKSYLRDAMSRLDAKTRQEAVVQARRRGFIP